MTRQHITEGGLDVLYEPGFLPEEEATGWFEELRTQADWHRPKMKFMGKEVETRRLVAWHADEGFVYSYSGQEHEWRNWTPAMQAIRERVETRMDMRFNGVLLNMYRDGSEYVSPHADDEHDMEPGTPIVAVSLGATRDFVVKHIESQNRYILPLEHGSLVVMAGETQKVGRHSIPKRAGVTTARISLTFRRATRRA